jgi:elongation factor P hydroxylase
MQASDKFQQPTVRVNEMWQTDFGYWFYPEITDTLLRVDNPHLEVKNDQKTIYSRI